MTIIGIGTDIIEILRIKAALTRRGERLAHRILSPYEWLKYQKNNHKLQFLAKRFAAKEAAAKALGTGIRSGLTFSQFEVYNDPLGKPLLYLFANAAERARQLGVAHMHVTLADVRLYAYATVILER